MTITDKKVLRMLTSLNCYELEERIEDMDETDRDGRSDIQVFADEVSLFLSNYNEDGHTWHDDLTNARALLRETKQGTVIPLDSRTLKPKDGYRPYDIEGAKNIVDEYNRLKRTYTQLKKSGVHGRWY